MAKHSLVIVESPAKAKTIGKYLGKEFEVKACMGHLRDLPKSTLGVDLEHDFEPVYKPIKGKEDIIADLKKSAKSAEMVYLATDPDREGEAISWHLKQLLNLPDEKTRRVTFNEITKNVVQESIREPRDIDQKLVDAQQARRILDRIVGYELSPLLWKKIRRGLSAGRVQSVATRMVDDRDREIEAFQPEEYWTLDANLLGNDLKKMAFEQCDYVIASVHNKDFTEGASREQVTRMYLRVLEDPKVLILGHIGRTGLDFDIDTVLGAVKEHGKLIEVNESSLIAQKRAGSYKRCRQIVERCAELGVSISFGSDAHVSSLVGHHEAADALLNEVHFPQELVACRDAATFAGVVESVIGPMAE